MENRKKIAESLALIAIGVTEVALSQGIYGTGVFFGLAQLRSALTGANTDQQAIFNKTAQAIETALKDNTEYQDADFAPIVTLLSGCAYASGDIINAALKTQNGLLAKPLADIVYGKLPFDGHDDQQKQLSEKILLLGFQAIEQSQDFQDLFQKTSQIKLLQQNAEIVEQLKKLHESALPPELQHCCRDPNSLAEGQGLRGRLRQENQAYVQYDDVNIHYWLDRLYKNPEPLVIRGDGGLGKTRMALEMVELSRGLFLPLLIEQNVTIEQLSAMFHHAKNQQKGLLLVIDYIENLNQQDGLTNLLNWQQNNRNVRLLITTRHVGQHHHQNRLVADYCQILDLSAEDLREWRKSVVQQILGAELLQEHSELDKLDNPAIATLLAYDHAQGTAVDIAQDQSDYGWMINRLTRGLKPEMADDIFAMLLTLYPHDQAVRDVLCQNPDYQTVLEHLEDQGWVSRTGTEPEQWRLGHDLLADWPYMAVVTAQRKLGLKTDLLKKMAGMVPDDALRTYLTSIWRIAPNIIKGQNFVSAQKLLSAMLPNIVGDEAKDAFVVSQLFNAAKDVFVVSQLFNAAFQNHEDDPKAYNDLINHYQDSDHPPVQELVAKAMFNRALTLNKNDDCPDAYEDVINHYRDNDYPPVQELVAKAMFNRAATLNKKDYCPENYEDVINHYRDSDHPPVQELVARAMMLRALTLNKNHDCPEGYDDVINHYRGNDHPPVQKRVAQAMMLRVVTFVQKDDFSLALQGCNDLIKHYRDNDYPPVQEIVAKAQAIKAKLEEALQNPPNAP